MSRKSNETSPKDTEMAKSNGTAKKPQASKASYQVSPQWAQPAINLTSTSLEVSFDQLRYQYFRTLDDDESTTNEKAIVITLRPKLEKGKWCDFAFLIYVLIH